MITANDESRPDDHQISSMAPSADTVANIELVARLVRLVEDQRRAESCAWADGWAAGYACARVEGEAAR